MAGFSLRLPENLESRLDEEARREGVARSEIARTAIAEFLERKERQRYIAAFVIEARAAYADPRIRKEALALAEEAVPLDNEGLRVAETRVSYRDGSAASPRRKKPR
ncbi:MAG: ribbon-helix-helix protein, CopG family [Steroidobacteraceae bacterium]